MKIKRSTAVLGQVALVLMLTVGCNGPRKPDPAWAGTYICIESSDFWESPAHCILFEKGYTMELRKDGTLAIDWSQVNCSPWQDQLLPPMYTSEEAAGKWWSRKEHLFMEITLPLGVADMGPGVRLVGLPVQIKLRGYKTILSVRKVSPSELAELRFRNELAELGTHKEFFEPPWWSAEYVDRFGFVLQDGSKWVKKDSVLCIERECFVLQSLEDRRLRHLKLLRSELPQPPTFEMFIARLGIMVYPSDFDCDQAYFVAQSSQLRMKVTVKDPTLCLIHKRWMKELSAQALKEEFEKDPEKAQQAVDHWKQDDPQTWEEFSTTIQTYQQNVKEYRREMAEPQPDGDKIDTFTGNIEVALRNLTDQLLQRLRAVEEAS